MRIISGSLRGRNIVAPGNLPVRPTTDFAKESLFNILNNHFDYAGLAVLDLFCGTGNISYEFASRGCGSVQAVDINYKCYAFVKETAEKFHLETVIRSIKYDCFKYLRACPTPFDIIFADPPYDLEGIGNIPQLVFERKLLNPGGWLVVEHSEKTDLSGYPGFMELRHYGKVNFSIFKQDE